MYTAADWCHRLQALYVLSSVSSAPVGGPPESLLTVITVQGCGTHVLQPWLTAVRNLPGPKHSLCHRPSMPCPHSYPPNWAFSLTEYHEAVLFSFSFC